jgi:hypothetical protein
MISPGCVAANFRGSSTMFARWLFRLAGIYGLLVLLPQYFLEERVGQDHPPAITHPEYFYGFVGVGVAWQVAFLVMAQDPARYRLLILPAILEKGTFGLATIALFAQQRLSSQVLLFGIIDLIWGSLFAAAFWQLGRIAEPPDNSIAEGRA